MVDFLPGRDANEVQMSILDEHRLLAERIDDACRQVDTFFSAPVNQTPSEVRRVIVLLEDLLEVARGHFEHEEAEMVINAFPGLVFHKRDHDYLIKSLMDFTSALSHGTTPFSNDMGVNLRSWLIYHIKKYDDAYVAFMDCGRT